MNPSARQAAVERLTQCLHQQELPLVCGIVNVTPDSFSDGGRFLSHGAAVAHALDLDTQGADLLDVGGESTRPGSRRPSVQEEIDRVAPVVESLVRRTATPVSVDTSRPAVMRAAVDAGAVMINDVRALEAPGAIEVASSAGVLVCLSHMRGDPETMQQAPTYGNVLAEVVRYLKGRQCECQSAGIPADRIVLDPGIGFGKTLEHNLELLRGVRVLAGLGPVMIGTSRKSLLGELTGRPVRERLAASLASALVAAQQGARVLRVHDVAETRDALVVGHALHVGVRVRADDANPPIQRSPREAHSTPGAQGARQSVAPPRERSLA